MASGFRRRTALAGDVPDALRATGAARAPAQNTLAPRRADRWKSGREVRDQGESTTGHAMSEQLDISVIISTYNRCELLPSALESLLLAQKADGVRYEVIIVDNNSTDQTRQVIDSFIARGYDGKLRYVFE